MIEAVVSVAIAAVLFVALSRMMIGAMQISQTGSSHLTNLLAADIVMQQLLEDLKQTRSINSDPAALTTGRLDIERFISHEGSAKPGITTVSWKRPDTGNGMIRVAAGKEHLFYPDRRFTVEFRRVIFPPQNSIGMLVTLKVSTPPDNSEEQGFRRFVYLDSMPENRSKNSNWQPVE